MNNAIIKNSENEVVQLIFVCDRCEIADDSNSETPSWPVSDVSARWHKCKFEGQRVAFGRWGVEFGFLARKMPTEDVGELDFDDLPSDVYIAHDTFYKSI